MRLCCVSSRADCDPAVLPVPLADDASLSLLMAFIRKGSDSGSQPHEGSASVLLKVPYIGQWVLVHKPFAMV